ncbi:MAG: hypothetical protein F7C35_06860 [Desulfurococcales archaeon]|nr:hypothetical protein [Desulfurococcales archaeon]
MLGPVKVEAALIVLLIVSYIGINFTADLPKFLIGENLLYATLYTLTLVAIVKGRPLAQPLALLVSSFNAGRVSRSIVSPRGEIQELALQHLPLLALILAVTILSFILTLKGR